MQLSSLTERALRAAVRQGVLIMNRPGRRLVRFDVPTLFAVARRRGHLQDLGEGAFQEPLRRLEDSLEHEACLNFVGRVAAREDFVRMLVNRMQLQDWRRRHPEIAAEEVRAPWVITGLPRSGSTLLHGLLAEDPATRVLRHWEAMFPSPPPRRATYAIDPRIALADRQLRWFFRLAPNFRIIHPVGARLPEECVVILSHSFLSFQFSTAYFVPSYQAWLAEQDLRPAYDIHRRFLQLLQWRCPGERWVLKAPPHLPGLGALFTTYPDARVIMTHRDPLEVLASVASLHTALRGVFSDAVDPLAVGPEVSSMLADDIRRGLAARDRGCAPAAQCFDLRYADLLRDPLGAVRRIYRQFDVPLTPTALARMTRYLERHPKDRYGAHQYSLERFGLDGTTERERYRAYAVRFGL